MRFQEISRVTAGFKIMEHGKKGNFRKDTLTDSSASFCWTAKGIYGYGNNPLPTSFSSECQIPHVYLFTFNFFNVTLCTLLSDTHFYSKSLFINNFRAVYILACFPLSPQFWCLLSSKLFFHPRGKITFCFCYEKILLFCLMFSF